MLLMNKRSITCTKDALSGSPMLVAKASGFSASERGAMGSEDPLSGLGDQALAGP
jgi:hypothetical protein